MGNDTAAVLAGGRHQMLGDQRTTDRRHQRIAVHVEGIGLDGWQAVLVGEFVAGVDDDGFDRTAVERALTHHVHVFTALPEVDRDGDDLLTGLLADPADRHRGVQTAGIRQDDALGHELISFWLYGYVRFWIRAASSAPVIGSRAATKMVSSPAMVPTT